MLIVKKRKTLPSIDFNSMEKENFQQQILIEKEKFQQ